MIYIEIKSRSLANVHGVAEGDELKTEAKLLPRRKIAYKQFMSFRSCLTRMRRTHYDKFLAQIFHKLQPPIISTRTERTVSHARARVRHVAETTHNMIRVRMHSLPFSPFTLVHLGERSIF